MNAQYPDLRFMMTGSGVVSVSVLYGTTVIPAGTAAGSGSWAPTSIAVTGAGVPAAASGASAMINILLTGTNGTATVDDVYVDPWGQR